jgi:hypothetical protein
MYTVTERIAIESREEGGRKTRGGRQCLRLVLLFPPTDASTIDRCSCHHLPRCSRCASDLSSPVKLCLETIHLRIQSSTSLPLTCSRITSARHGRQCSRPNAPGRTLSFFTLDNNTTCETRPQWLLSLTHSECSRLWPKHFQYSDLQLRVRLMP